MTDLFTANPTSCQAFAGDGAVAKIIQPRDKDLGGFMVRRLLPVAGQQMVGPWIFFDHMGPAEFAPGTGINVRPHPHINLATVTYLFAGEILHRDSLGSLQPIRPGDINLMVAGRGIVHSERERPEVTAQPHQLDGLQLWLVLPEADEEIAPAFYHYPASQIPLVQVDAVPVRVIMGDAYGVCSPVRQFARTLYIEAELKAGQQLLLPSAEERALYVVSGKVQCDQQPICQYQLAVLNQGAASIQASLDCRIALIGGQAMARRYIEWNFVSSRKDRIEQAKADWQASRFPPVVGDEEEFIPLP